MPTYRNKNTGKLIEVLKGTKLPRTFERVREETKKTTVSIKKCTKHMKNVKKMQENADLCKKEEINDGK